MSQPPTRPGLSARLKHLDAEAPLQRPSFDLDDVVRGGRRRQRRRTVAQVAASVVVVAALSAGVALPQLRGGGEPAPVLPATAPPASSAPSLPGIDLAEDLNLTYQKTGMTVTMTKKGTRIGTMTLKSADYTAKTGRVVLDFDASRELIVDTNLFILWDAQSRENSVTKGAKLTLAPGPHTITLEFSDLLSTAEAVGWAPSNGEAVWPRNE